ncbi:MAG: aldo/keto reductase, partial [Alteromonadaceae bacterium]|nr:aldo/keto reductase [Alteromonadaceae bacterium]
DYGVSNNQGQVSLQEVNNILSLATEVGITTLDTASAYGNSEQVLGQSKLASQFNIVSKIPPLKETDSQNEIDQFIEKSLIQLKVKQLDAVLFHQVDDLIHSPLAQTRVEALIQQKKSGNIKKIGISIYTPEQLEYCINNFNIDIVQLPLNALDQRFITTGWLAKLTERGIEVHCRSVFLQGLLLMDIKALAPYFLPYLLPLKKFAQMEKKLAISHLVLSLVIACQQKHINKIVVGCCNVKQLQEIINTYNITLTIKENLAALAYPDENLLLPNNWKT